MVNGVLMIQTIQGCVDVLGEWFLMSLEDEATMSL
jgi:hypothetical protein